MIALSNHEYMTPEDYLIWAEKQPIKYEYINGEVLAMTGGTLNHNKIALNLASVLKNYLRGKGCQVFIADAKLRLEENNIYFYPDVMVTCDERDKLASKYVEYPCIIVEVLSDSTEANDRGKKFQQYRQLATLQEYVLISSDQMLVECFRRKEQENWELAIYNQGQEIEFKSIGFMSSLDFLYEEVSILA